MPRIAGVGKTRAGCPEKQSWKSKMAQRGGKRAGAGRKPGSVSKAKRDLMAKAKDHADAALATLVEVMQDRKAPPQARISAANSVLDRAYGKPIQATVEVPPDKAPQAFDGWSIERASKPDTPDAD